MKRKPIGFVATCQCGVVVGALDYTRTDRQEAGQIVGKWIHDGCTVTPRFGSSWSVTVYPCVCDLVSPTTGEGKRCTCDYDHVNDDEHRLWCGGPKTEAKDGGAKG